MKDTQLRRTLTDGLELWDRAVTAITTSDVLNRIHDQQATGLVTGSSGHSGSRTVMWCWTHSRELHQCHRDPDCDHGACRAESIAANDPTGEAAVRPDRASDHLDELARLADRLRSDGERITKILASYQRRPADERERRDSADGDPGCRSCARVSPHGSPLWSPVHRTPVIDGDTWPLCRWCYEWLSGRSAAGRLPTRDEVAYYADHGKRPPQKATA